jgi:hypothetical protein
MARGACLPGFHLLGRNLFFATMMPVYQVFINGTFFVFRFFLYFRISPFLEFLEFFNFFGIFKILELFRDY